MCVILRLEKLQKNLPNKIHDHNWIGNEREILGMEKNFFFLI